MPAKTIHLIGAPLDSGKRRQGCLMGPDAYRTAGLADALRNLGHTVSDKGNVTPDAFTTNPEERVYARAENIAWTAALSRAAEAACADGVPIFMGGDHALALGTVHGAAAHAADQNRPLFVLWLDAHTDYHTPDTTASGNLHGTPVGYVTGRERFDGFPDVPGNVPSDVETLN